MIFIFLYCPVHIIKTSLNISISFWFFFFIFSFKPPWENNAIESLQNLMISQFIWYLISVTQKCFVCVYCRWSTSHCLSGCHNNAYMCFWGRSVYRFYNTNRYVDVHFVHTCTCKTAVWLTVNLKKIIHILEHFS